MKFPPPPDVRLARPPSKADDQRDARFLVFVAAVLVALALGFKSELVAPGQVWGLGAGLLVLAIPALLGYLRTERALPSVEHFIPVAIGAAAVAGLSTFPIEWWKFALASGVFGLGFVTAGWLDRRRLRERDKPGHVALQDTVIIVGLAAAFLVVLTINLPLPLRLAWISTVSLLATYRSFRAHGHPMAPGRAFLFALFVAQPVTFFAWAIIAYLNYQEGPLAAILVFLWYVDRGIVRHAVEGTLNRNVILEYGGFILLLAYLFWVSYSPHAT